MALLSILAMVLSLAVLALIGWGLVQSVRKEGQQGRPFASQFGLSLALLVLFLGSWLAHGLAQWEVFQQEQQQHGEEPTASGFVTEFMQSTFENWQSEFLQLLTIVVLSTVLIHKGSANSRDSQDRIEQKLDQVLSRVGASHLDGPPNRGANKPEWIDYAVSQGASREEAEAMTKEDLIDQYGD